MICKWCGAKIREKDRTCPRCGQEIPPLSECGGFYDLVPGARQGAVPPVKPVSPVQPTNGPTGYYPPRKKKKNYNTLWLCVWAVLLFAVLALSVKSCSLSCELDRLDDRLSKVEKEQKDMGDGEGTNESIGGDNNQPESNPGSADETPGLDNPTGGDGSASATGQSILLTLNVTDEAGTIEIDESFENSNWKIENSLGTNGFFTLKYDGQNVFNLCFQLNDDKLWASEIKDSQDSGIQFHWEWKGTFANPDEAKSEGLTSTCPVRVSDDQTGLCCILTWEQDGQKYEVTTNFPSDQTKPNGSDGDELD